MQLINRKVVTMTALAVAISHALIASAADFNDVRSALAMQQSRSVNSARLDPAALAKAQQRFTQAQQIAGLFAAQYKPGADGTLDPRHVELVNNLMQGDARGFTDAVSAPSLEAALAAASASVVRRANTTTTSAISATTAEAAQTGSLVSGTDDVVYTAITPCRIVDTRQPGAGGAFASLQARTYDALGGVAQGGSSACSGYTGVIPSALALNITVQAYGLGDPAAYGFLSVYPEGGALGTSWLNFLGGQTVANAGVATINPNNGRFVIFAQNPTQVVVDAFGYFRTASGTTGGAT
ncbi:hypothetical protein, partial [Rudaea sp.]|uniref:hypothetical protein n=1 Tax=Rudaea sp. TaxID=2136325 RepID=UPI00321F75CE